jgi:hypothetical protein
MVVSVSVDRRIGLARMERNSMLGMLMNAKKHFIVFSILINDFKFSQRFWFILRSLVANWVVLFA